MTTSQETKVRTTVVTDLEQLDQMYKGSYYTITGAGGELSEWTKGYTEYLQQEQIGTPKEFFIFKGDQMNHKYQLAGSVAYDKDLTFISFPLDDLDVGKLAMFKIRMQDRWFDDIVDNNERHMKGE